MQGRAVRSKEEVWQALSTPMRQRQQFITALASKCTYYSVDEWRDWYAWRPLSDPHMDSALWQWKRDFPMHHKTRKKNRGSCKKTPEKAIFLFGMGAAYVVADN